MWNVMTDPLIRVRTRSGVGATFALPELLAELVHDRIGGFTGLQPFQHHAWHAFLTQLAAMAIHVASADQQPPPTDPEVWGHWLRGLTPDHQDDAPWQLVVTEVTKPAFLQPPLPEKALVAANWKGPLTTPDLIGLLNNAKNHDIKQARMDHPSPDLWLYALVGLQTMQGFLGAGNYGIVRMNGGFASRAGVGLVNSLSWGGRFRRDLAMLLAKREQILEDHPGQYQEEGGITLTWLIGWDGESAIGPNRLDPYFIEVCRRIRLTGQGEQVMAWTRTTVGTRIRLGAEEKWTGLAGDPWSPISSSKKGDTSLTVSGKGLSYDLIAALLFPQMGAIQPSPAMKHQPEDQGEDLALLARVLVRGQGKTEGYHERHTPIPPRVRGFMLDPTRQGQLASLTTERIAAVAKLRQSVLSPALLTLLQGAPNKLNFKDKRVGNWLTRFDRQVDDHFFPQLWQGLPLLEQEQDDAFRLNWVTWLKLTGQKILAEAEQAVPLPSARRYKVLQQANGVFYGSLYKHFPLLKPTVAAQQEESA